MLSHSVAFGASAHASTGPPVVVVVVVSPAVSRVSEPQAIAAQASRAARMFGVLMAMSFEPGNKEGARPRGAAHHDRLSEYPRVIGLPSLVLLNFQPLA